MTYTQYEKVEKTLTEFYRSWDTLDDGKRNGIVDLFTSQKIKEVTIYSEEEYELTKQKLSLSNNNQNQLELERICMIYENYRTSGSGLGISYGEEGLAFWVTNEPERAEDFIKGIAKLGLDIRYKTEC